MTTIIEPANTSYTSDNQPPSSEQCLNALVDVLPRLMRVFKSQMRGGKLSPQQLFLLMGIQELNQLHEDGAQPGELARRACLSSAAITAALDDLVDGGYCVRAHSEKDRRKVLVQLTPYGCDMLREARANASEAMRGLINGWSEDRRLRLYHVLQELDDAASEFIRQAHPTQEHSA